MTIEQKIADGTVSVNDFDMLISEALAKSATERALRHARPRKVGPADKSSKAATTVPRREGLNDPPNQGRGKRYASGKPARKRQNEKLRRQYVSESAQSILAAVVWLSRINDGRNLVEQVTSYDDRIVLRAVISALLLGDSNKINPKIADSLYEALQVLDNALIADGVDTSLIPGLSIVIEDNRRVKEVEKSKEKPDKEEQERTYTVKARADHLNEFERLLHWLDYCSSVGHSGTAKISIDGDGAGKLDISGLASAKPEESELEPQSFECKAEISIGIA